MHENIYIIMEHRKDLKKLTVTSNFISLIFNKSLLAINELIFTENAALTSMINNAQLDQLKKKHTPYVDLMKNYITLSSSLLNMCNSGNVMNYSRKQIIRSQNATKRSETLVTSSETFIDNAKTAILCLDAITKIFTSLDLRKVKQEIETLLSDLEKTYFPKVRQVLKLKEATTPINIVNPPTVTGNSEEPETDFYEVTIGGTGDTGTLVKTGGHHTQAFLKQQQTKIDLIRADLPTLIPDKKTAYMQTFAKVFAEYTPLIGLVNNKSPDLVKQVYLFMLTNSGCTDNLQDQYQKIISDDIPLILAYHANRFGQTHELTIEKTTLISSSTTIFYTDDETAPFQRPNYHGIRPIHLPASPTSSKP